MGDPEKVVASSEETVTIKDGYPKAKYHFLTLSKQDIPSLSSVRSSHLPLMKEILENGQKIEKKIKAEDTSSMKMKFRHGYHAVPSMSRLHMHTISQDLDSPCLKHKKHWNSFTTGFFIDAEEIIAMLESKGRVEIDRAKYEALLKTPLQCHVCHVELPNMPRLKEHIRKHL